MLRKSISIIIFCILAMGAVSELPSTTLMKAELPELVQNADLIVLGTITGSECSWMLGDGDQKLIYTTYTLEVEESLKGTTAENRITFKVIGGEVNDVVLNVPSTPHYDIGERVVLLLGSDGVNRLSDVVGWTQGSFHVVDGMVVEQGTTLDDFLARLSDYVQMEE